MADNAVLDYLKKQILASSNSAAWTGQGFGSADANAADMARILANAGLTDISQFGQRTVTTPGAFVSDGDYGGYQAAATTSSQFYNKATGQAIDANYDRAGGNIWSGTFAGSGSTGYGAQFDASGNPHFYTQYGGSTSDAGSILPILNIALMAMGIPAELGELLGASAGSAAAAGIGNAVIGGTEAALTGGNVLQSAALSGAGGYYGTQFSDYLDTKGITGMTNSALTGAAVNGTTAALTGQDPLTGAIKGAAMGAAGSLAKDFVNPDLPNGIRSQTAKEWGSSWDATDAAGVTTADMLLPNGINSTAAKNWGSSWDATDAEGVTDNLLVQGDKVAADDTPELVVTADRPANEDTPELVVTDTKIADETTSDVIDPGEIVHHDVSTDTDTSTTNDPGGSVVTPPPKVVTPTTTSYQIMTANPVAAGVAPTYSNAYGQLDVAANDVAQRLTRGRSSTILTGGRGEDESKLSTSNILLGR